MSHLSPIRCLNSSIPLKCSATLNCSTCIHPLLIVLVWQPIISDSRPFRLPSIRGSTCCSRLCTIRGCTTHPHMSLSSGTFNRFVNLSSFTLKTKITFYITITDGRHNDQTTNPAAVCCGEHTTNPASGWCGDSTARHRRIGHVGPPPTGHPHPTT